MMIKWPCCTWLTIAKRWFFIIHVEANFTVKFQCIHIILSCLIILNDLWIWSINERRNKLDLLSSSDSTNFISRETSIFAVLELEIFINKFSDIHMNKSFKNLQLNAVDIHRTPKNSKEFNKSPQDGNIESVQNWSMVNYYQTYNAMDGSLQCLNKLDWIENLSWPEFQIMIVTIYESVSV